MPRLVVNLPDKLYAELEDVLRDRNLSFEEMVRLYSRSLITSNARAMALSLEAEMPFGRYRGELVDVVIRAEPGYISWMLANNDRFMLAPDALALYEQMTAPKVTEPKKRGRPRKIKLVGETA